MWNPESALMGRKWPPNRTSPIRSPSIVSKMSRCTRSSSESRSRGMPSSRSRKPRAAAARRSMSASVMDPRVVGETPASEAAKRGSS